MKPSFVVSLLLLSLLLAKTQGIRLGKVSSAVQQQKQHDGESTLLKRSSTDTEEASLCKDNACTGNIKNRKLVNTPVSTAQSLSKNVEESKVDPSVNGNTRNVNTLSTSKHKDVPEEHYHDLVEITEMDYSPAKRKPPIHN
ncbi:hypothetical protein AAZX31_13G149400 [Glycine max]|uniref:Phytosulfokine-beta n=2 Tax=Glycine subgen. Soja TaxID=1462606 RepID=I1LZW1_SOYBN|nr:uncharacterized protein LOC100782109 [Glycine max]XP_028189082.1 uncharacterized protein LOC114375495 isoform X2 [Glycine soja]KAG4959774.1 hypothetical protein JHK87_036407 [Glycine soja]KAG4970800.1 hypothetical protein JHK85_037221 [Glycine max]KAG4977199.1 hypothetical protein JHK86_036673 [Glycine max]KAG5113225.1 hypothetical protein JHK82_036494 [Glycine max]KAG5130503.1 hypothetical protein JHK84_036900 [Glycine max]|eukprot:XP_003542667.1 uncharacterized protein LOC100782109 [Glycine max]